MRASNIELKELIEFKKGKISLHGRRLIIHDIHAMALFRKELIAKSGMTIARKILTRFGYFDGQADAAAMKRLFSWRDVTEQIKAGAQLQSLKGAANARFLEIEYDKEQASFFAKINWFDSVEAEEHLIENGVSDMSVCWILCGYISGYVSYCIGKKVYFIEEKCVAKNDRTCSAIGRDVISWENKIDTEKAFFRGEDILTKIDALTEKIKKKNKEIREQKKKLDRLTLLPNYDYLNIKSQSFKYVFNTAARASQFNSYILINGESGTGKEVLARFIHRSSKRSLKPFIALNCGALPDSLLESELFGYNAGAFTGAKHSRRGIFEEADKGTIFLDEIGDISKNMQVKLLRVLQEQEVLRLGENIPRKIDVRVIAATNCNLQEKIASGDFRSDLYYRLSVVEIKIPPLRDRLDDIVPLIRHFLERLSKKLNIKNLRIHPLCIKYMLSYNWPGNIRELEHALEYAVIFAHKGEITIDCLPGKLANKNTDFLDVYKSGDISLDELEKKYIQYVLDKNNGNKAKTAKCLGISTVTLWRKFNKYEMH